MEFDSHFDSAAVMSESFASEAFQPIEREQEFKYVPESFSEPSIDFEPSYEEEEEAKPSIESSFSSFAFSRPSPQPHSSSPSQLRKSSTRSLSSGAPRRPSAERVSMAEYERQSKEYTRQQLRSSGLYLKHRVHFAKMNLREVVAELWRLARKMVFPALVIATVLLTLLGLYLIFSEPGLRSTSGVYMLPPSIPEPRARSGSAGGANANATAQQNATASGVLSVPQLVLDYVVSTAGEVLPSLSSGQQSADAKAGGSEAPRANYDAPVATYDPTLRVTSYIRNQTEKGMNIFTFAYTVAYDYAFSVIGRAFGWSLANDSSSSPSSSSAKGSR